MKLSHILCSRNRAAGLKTTLSTIHPGTLAANELEIILVYSSSDDATSEVMRSYAQERPGMVHVARADSLGLSQARNAGLRAATGDLIVFTDDDCYLHEQFYNALLQDFDSGQYQYGMGQALLYDPSDESLAIRVIQQKTFIPPKTLLPAGTIQGANMFFLRAVFDAIGNFAEDLKGGEDIEFAARASLAGFAGVLLPSVVVFHHHGRKRGSAESRATLRQYDLDRGAYYAVQLTRGVNAVWQLWGVQSALKGGKLSPAALVRLEGEFRGAAEYLSGYLKKTEN